MNRREHIWNSYSSDSFKVGGTIPVLCVPCNKRMHGAMVINPLNVGERVSAGTPFEYNIEKREAKFLKCWKIKSVSVNEAETVVTLYRTKTTPVLHSNTIVMVMPSTLNGTGKAGNCGTVTEKENTYEISLTTENFDALSTGGYLVESSSDTAGSGKSPYCIPNNISTEDTVKGTDNTLVDVPRGHVYMYLNTIPAMPDVVKNALFNSDVQVAFEMFNEAAE